MIHAETITVAVAEADGTLRSLGTICHREDAVRKLVKKVGVSEQLRACYEAGRRGTASSGPSEPRPETVARAPVTT